jgi:integrase/recombinase XerD
MKTNTSLTQTRPYVHQRYRQLPLFGRFLDEFVPWAFSRGYTKNAIYLQLDSVRHLDAWCWRHGRRTVADLTVDDLAHAHHCLSTQYSDARYGCGLRGFMEFLQTRGYLQPARPQPVTRSEEEVSRYLEHLRKDCGAAESTCDSSRRLTRRFLKFLSFDRHANAIRRITLADIHRYFCSLVGRYQRKTMQHVVGNVRGFLRFQFMRGSINSPLHLQIDTVRTYREEQLPHPVSWPELQHLLVRIDRSGPLGLRDYAVLLLAATYGLRASDVANLTFDAIDWRNRTIQITQCKTRQPLALPLTDEVGAALADYIRRGRPVSDSRYVFLRWRAPVAPLSLPGMANTLRRASGSAKVPLQEAGFRCLRHALALRLLRQGTSLKGIGDILGHRSTLSTATYLRLDIDDLRSVALPVPVATGEYRLNKMAKLVLRARSYACARRAPDGWRWSSFLGMPMRDYVAIQRSLGRRYEEHEDTLYGLDFFLARQYPHARKLTAAMFASWAAGLHSLCPTTARMRMLQVRKFCCHLARITPGMFVPDLRTFPKEVPHQAPYLLSEPEMARILAATAKLWSTRSDPIHPQTIRVAFLLTFCCGLRSGEILKLQIADIDTEEMVLSITETKFHKSRLVPLSPSVADELRQYLLERRHRNMPMEPAAPLVLNGHPRRNGRACALTVFPFWATWQRVCCCAEVFDHRNRPPRLHDMRHSFAVEALRRGYSMGQNAQMVLPRLARYMGHSGVQFTHYYLKFTEPLRCAANDLFRQHLVAVLPPDHQQMEV